MRFAVTGGRDFANGLMVRLAFGKLLHYSDVLVHGAAPGADTLAARQWEAWGNQTDPHPADWTGPCRPTCKPGHRRPRGDDTICPAAGVYRNQDMVDSGLDLLIAFPGGRGTADMVKRAKAAGVRVVYADQIVAG